MIDTATCVQNAREIFLILEKFFVISFLVCAAFKICPGFRVFSPVFFPQNARGGGGHQAADFVVCFGCGGISFFLFSFSSLRTHTACCKYETALPHLPLYY